MFSFIHMHILIQILLWKKQNKLHSLRPPSILGSDVVLCCCGPVLKFSLWSRDPGVCLFGMPGSVAEERYQSSLWLKKEVKNLLPFPFPQLIQKATVGVCTFERERERALRWLICQQPENGLVLLSHNWVTNVPPWFPVLLTLLFTSHTTSGAFTLDVRDSLVLSPLTPG
jgi:hypothetical protein